MAGMENCGSDNLMEWFSLDERLISWYGYKKQYSFSGEV